MAVPHLPLYTSPPITLRVFRSGLRVLHTPKYGQPQFAEYLFKLLSETEGGFLTSIDIASRERISVGLSEEMIQSAVDAGFVARDEGGASGLDNWYANLIHTYRWDGQEN
jgi:ESCRT-II complex subunit VPS36